MISLTLDHKLEKVYVQRTREYFSEVLRTYAEIYPLWCSIQLLSVTFFTNWQN